jgi:uncharacterized protein YoxC
MNFPSDTPRLPKWIFLVGYAVLLAAAWLVYDSSAHPLTATALWSLVALVVAACIIGVIPFVTAYADKQEEAFDNRQRALQALSVTVAAAAEQVSIAATGLNGIAEAAQENFSKSERLALGIQDKIAELDLRLEAAGKRDGQAVSRLESVAKAVAELDARLVSAKKEDGEAAARLEAAAKKLVKAAAEFESAVEKAAETARAIPAPPQIPEVPPVIASKIAEIKPAAASSDHPFEAHVAPAASPAVEPPEPARAPEPAPAPEPVTEAAAAPVAPPVPEIPPQPAAPPPAENPPAPGAPPAPRKRSPRKPAPAPLPPAEPVVQELVLESPPAADETGSAIVPQEVHEPALSADGATRLIITAYIGIGNRLFIRGEGPGLSWDKGVPLTFVSIGKWRWETNDASKAVTFRLYKNDETECAALGERAVEPGAQLELNASF